VAFLIEIATAALHVDGPGTHRKSRENDMKLIDTVHSTGGAVEKVFSLSSNRPGDMDILDTLKREHEEVSGLLDQLVSSHSSRRRKILLKKIKAAFIPHVRAEEKVVYDAIIARKEKSSKIDGEEGYLEHDLAGKMLMTLGKISNATLPEFGAAAKVLKEFIAHHVEDEECNVWIDVRKHFNGKQRIEMNRKFEAAKKKIRVA